VIGYLTQLAARSLSPGDAVRPRVSALFEPASPAPVGEWTQAVGERPQPTAAWPQPDGEFGADQVGHPGSPGGQTPPGTGPYAARPGRPASRRDVPAGRPSVAGPAASPSFQLPAPQETEVSEVSEAPRPAALSGPSAAPSQAGDAAGMGGRRTRTARPGRRSTREGSTPPRDRPSRAGSRTRVPPQGQPPVRAGENLTQPPPDDRAAPEREAPATADSVAIRSREHGAAVCAAQEPPAAGTGHLPAPVTVRTRRSLRTELTSAGGPSEPAATVQVTIGRVEVRAVTAPAPRTRPDRERQPMMTLAEHLQAREGGR
jgi:hypothetical protein